MSTKFAMAVLVVWLVGCQTVSPTATMMPSPALTPLTPLPLATPTVAVPPTASPEPTIRPRPTSLIQGWNEASTTSNPSPACPDAYPWFFDNQAQECAGGVMNTWGTIQHFEHGLMVWFQDYGRTYVLIDDGSPFKPYQEVSDPGVYQSAPGPEVDPPPGRYAPQLGFAKFWRGLIPGYEWIRPRLGWATGPEKSYSALWQCNTVRGEAARCYFTGPHDEVIVMSRGSAPYWNSWQGPVR